MAESVFKPRVLCVLKIVKISTQENFLDVEYNILIIVQLERLRNQHVCIISRNHRKAQQGDVRIIVALICIVGRRMLKGTSSSRLPPLVTPNWIRNDRPIVGPIFIKSAIEFLENKYRQQLYFFYVILFLR